MKNINTQWLQNFGGASRSIAFTLAEMMVVLLIMSIVLACMAPVMTTKMKAEQNIQTSPWKWVQQGAGRDQDAYFGNGNLQMAHIGETERSEGDSAKLIINNSNLDDMILFKNGENVLGHLRLTGNNLALGAFESLGTNSIAIGSSTSAGDNATVLGVSAQATSDGIAIGYNSKALNNSIAIGVSALSANTTGFSNTAVGKEALKANTTGSTNTAVGSSALNENTTGFSNTAIGVSALSANTTGFSNTAVGKEALKANTTGNDNVAVGSAALSNNTTGHSNIAIGVSALLNNTTGQLNTAIGVLALTKNTEGTGNTAIGSDALSHNTTGSSNTAVGSAALPANTTGFSNTAVGSTALLNNTEGYFNTAIGPGALHYNTTGSDNIAIGVNALHKNTTGSDNIVIGDHAVIANTTGSNNTVIGKSALISNETGTGNTAIGHYACMYVTGSNKTCIGANSGPTTSDHAWAKDDVERIFIGSQSRFNNGAAVLEVHNGTARYGISKNNITSPETAVVVNGVLVVKGGIYTAMPKLGSNAHEATGSAEAFLLGSDDGSPYIRSTYSGQTGFGDYFHGYGKFKHPSGVKDVHLIRSDRRLKYVGKENTDGLAKLRQLKIFNYTFKKDEKKTPHVGVIAQDLQKIFPNAVKKGADGFLTIRMEDMFYAVINAIKELDAKYQAQEKRIENLEKRIQVLESKIK